MSGGRRRWLPLTVLVGAVGLLVASIVWGAGPGWGSGVTGPGAVGPGGVYGPGVMGPGGVYGPGAVGPGGMMGSAIGGGMGGLAIAGEGPVGSLDDAGRAAARFADRWGLTVGEVMQFDNGFYAELVDQSGNLATEVLIDPSTGAVQIEYGPAMMWNTAYGMGGGMMGGGVQQPGAGVLSPERARSIADSWLQQQGSGLRADEADALPGYYTLHTLRGDQVEGMLSVHSTSGAVWYHGWHGSFIAMAGDNPE